MKKGKLTIAELGPRLKEVRQELGVTQRELAQELNINQAIISKFENGGMVYASVLLDILMFFRGSININFLLQPGKYDFTDERARFSNDEQRDIVVNRRLDIAIKEFTGIMEKGMAAYQENMNEGMQCLKRFAEFCNSDMTDDPNTENEDSQ